jgi:hypothetical protein
MTWRLVCVSQCEYDEHKAVLPALTKVMQAISQLPLRLLKKPMLAVEKTGSGCSVKRGLELVFDSNVVGTRWSKRSPLHIDEALLACKRNKASDSQAETSASTAMSVLSSDATATRSSCVCSSPRCYLRIPGNMVLISVTRMDTAECVSPWGHDGEPCGPADP